MTRLQALRASLERTQHRILRLVGKLDDRFRGGPGVLWRALAEVTQFHVGLWAAAIAYFALLAIFPLTLLSIAVASHILGPSGNLSFVIQQLEFLAPALGDLMGQNIAAVMRARGSVSIVAFIALVWTASILLRGLGGILQQIWQAEYIRPSWQRNGVAVTLILLLAGPFLVIGLLVGSTFASLHAFLPEDLQFVASGLSLLVAIVMNISLFLVLYGVMPHGTASFRDLLPGAIAAGLLWEAAKRGFALFVDTYMSQTNLIYGSVASIIAFLTWAYASGLILLFGVYISVYSHERRLRRDGRGRLLRVETLPQA